MNQQGQDAEDHESAQTWMTPLTESRNPTTEAIDLLLTLDMVRLMNAEDDIAL